MPVAKKSRTRKSGRRQTSFIPYSRKKGARQRRAKKNGMNVEVDVKNKKDENVGKLTENHSRDQSFEVDREALLPLKDCSATNNQVVATNFDYETILLAEQKIEKEETIFEGDICYANGIYSFPLTSPKKKEESMSFQENPDAILELDEDNVQEEVQVMCENDEDIFSSANYDNIECNLEKSSSDTMTAYEDDDNMSTFSTISICVEDDKMSTCTTVTAISSQITPDKKMDEESNKTSHHDQMSTYSKIPACKENDRLITGYGSQDTSGNELDKKSIENEEVKKDILKNKIIDGNRIVDLEYLINSILKLAYDEDDKHKVSCIRRRWEIKGSSEKGFKTYVTLFCEGCHTTIIQKSHPTDPNKMDINTAMVLGTMTAGSGYSNMQELLAPAGIPCISSTAFLTHQKNMVRLIIETSEEIMRQNGRDEREALIKKGLFKTVEGPNGKEIIPLGTVHCDGSWLQRSFAGGLYGSLGGAVTVVGSETKKPLDLRVKCKSCATCESGGTVKKHDCFKNFNRDQASSLMEKVGTVEAFQDSMNLHQIVYKNFVGDGDSNVMSGIVSADPYKKYAITVKKLACTNHALKNHTNYCKAVRPKLPKLTKLKRKFATKTRKFVLTKNGRRVIKTNASITIQRTKTLRKRMTKAREILKTNVQRFRKEIKAAAKRRRENGQLSYDQKIELLKKDILNIPYHVFGRHNGCSSLGGWPCVDQKNDVEKKSDPLEMVVTDSDIDLKEKDDPAKMTESNDFGLEEKSDSLETVVTESNVVDSEKESDPKKMMVTDNNDIHDEQEDIIALLDEVDVLPQLLRLHGRLFLIIESLLLDTTTNLVEAINSLICKYCAGKRLGISRTGNYCSRCHCAIIAWSNKHLQSTVMKHAGKVVPTSVLTMEKTREAKIERNKKYVSKKRRDKKVNKCSDKNYGPSAEKPDMDEKMFEIQKEIFLKTLRTYQENRIAIAERTVDQSLSHEWKEFHRKMLTSAQFGEICKRRETTLCSALVKKLLYPSTKDPSDAAFYGLENEPHAREALSKMIGHPIKPTGMWIDPDLQYLAASPDGLIDVEAKDLRVFGSKVKGKKPHLTYSVTEGGVVEIKCPQRGEDLSPADLLETYPDLRNVFDKQKPNLYMNTKHSYYYQIQGQMHSTRRAWGLFALWTPMGMKVIFVWRDDDFWKKMMEPRLTRFYFDCMLPEIIDSRISRSMQIREPEYILEKRAIKKKPTVDVNTVEERQSKRMIEDVQIDDEISWTENKTKKVSMEDEMLLLDKKSKRRKDDVQTDEEISLTEIETKKMSIEDEMLPTENNNPPNLAWAPPNLEPCLKIIKSESGWLDDEGLDAFLEVVRKHSNLETLSVHNITPHMKVPKCTNDRDVQILGGNVIVHWRCYYYENGTSDDRKLTIFDSFHKNLKYKDLSEHEKIFIKKRYPKLSANKVRCICLQEQPDGSTCGVYSAANCASIALGLDPLTQKYSVKSKKMRNYLAKIIKEQKLTRFPQVEKNLSKKEKKLFPPFE